MGLILQVELPRIVNESISRLWQPLKANKLNLNLINQTQTNMILQQLMCICAWVLTCRVLQLLAVLELFAEATKCSRPKKVKSNISHNNRGNLCDLYLKCIYDLSCDPLDTEVGKHWFKTSQVWMYNEARRKPYILTTKDWSLDCLRCQKKYKVFVFLSFCLF